MKVGFVGLGKLGLPVAVAMASRGIEVYGYDVREPDYAGAVEHEDGFLEAYRNGAARFYLTSLYEVVNLADVIFLAVQTPHEARFEGVTPLPKDRADFDYSYLRQAVRDIVGASTRPLTLSVISTVLPGTMEREIEPLLPEHVSLVYNPSFIAMGTTIADFLDPEFILLGGDGGVSVDDVVKVYQHTLGVGALFYETSIPNAELIKVSYNTFIGLKIAFANTLMEVCQKTGCDVDEVTGALKLANRRLISGAYLDGGMGDGGGCHPRDNIALSWLAGELDLSYDLFGAAMEAREAQAGWLASLMIEQRLPLGILGTAYKPGSHLETGSCARLVKCLLHDRFGIPWRSILVYDPHVEAATDYQGADSPTPWAPRCWLVGCKHPEFHDLKLPEGSVVIDPFRYIPDQPGVEVIRVGLGAAAHDGQAADGAALRQAA